MAMSVGSSEGQSYSDINMTPLIDVMLVLLIIFIITIPSQTHAVKIDNPLPPPPNQPPPPPPEVIDLSIDFDGTLLWNKTPVDRTTLQGYISDGSCQGSAARSAYHRRQICEVRDRGADAGRFAASGLEEDRVRQQRLFLIGS